MRTAGAVLQGFRKVAALMERDGAFTTLRNAKRATVNPEVNVDPFEYFLSARWYSIKIAKLRKVSARQKTARGM